MLRITSAQEERLAELRWLSFEDEMVAHLREFAPEHCAVIGEHNVRVTIRRGIERCARYGFTYRGPIRFYIELMFMFGSDFDTDPQFPQWGRQLLADGDEHDQMYRAELMHGKLGGFFDEVIGADHGRIMRALERTLEFSRAPLPYADDDLVDGLLHHMQMLHPEKYAYLGAPAHRSSIERGLATASSLRLDSARGKTTVCLVMSMMGHGALYDPLYPWLKVALREGVPPHRQAQRLERRVIIYLDKTIENLEARTHG